MKFSIIIYLALALFPINGPTFGNWIYTLIAPSTAALILYFSKEETFGLQVMLLFRYLPCFFYFIILCFLFAKLRDFIKI